jgi:hypothetical protein
MVREPSKKESLFVGNSWNHSRWLIVDETINEAIVDL